MVYLLKWQLSTLGPRAAQVTCSGLKVPNVIMGRSALLVQASSAPDTAGDVKEPAWAR